MSRKWNLAICGLLCLISFSELHVFSRFVHGADMSVLHFVSWLTDILLYGFISRFCLYIHQLMNWVIFILGANMNNSAMNIYIQVPCVDMWFYFISSMYLRIGL